MKIASPIRMLTCPVCLKTFSSKTSLPYIHHQTNNEKIRKGLLTEIPALQRLVGKSIQLVFEARYPSMYDDKPLGTLQLEIIGLKQPKVICYGDYPGPDISFVLSKQIPQTSEHDIFGTTELASWYKDQVETGTVSLSLTGKDNHRLDDEIKDFLDSKLTFSEWDKLPR